MFHVKNDVQSDLETCSQVRRVNSETKVTILSSGHISQQTLECERVVDYIEFTVIMITMILKIDKYIIMHLPYAQH